MREKPSRSEPRLSCRQGEDGARPASPWRRPDGSFSPDRSSGAGSAIVWRKPLPTSEGPLHVAASPRTRSAPVDLDACGRASSADLTERVGTGGRARRVIDKPIGRTAEYHRVRDPRADGPARARQSEHLSAASAMGRVSSMVGAVDLVKERGVQMARPMWSRCAGQAEGRVRSRSCVDVAVLLLLAPAVPDVADASHDNITLQTSNISV